MITRDKFTSFLRELEEKPNEILESFAANIGDAAWWEVDTNDDADTAWWNDDAEYC